MQNLANIAVDLLCALTFQPPEGNDPDEIAELEQSAWQTLIHDLSPPERDAVQASVRRRVEELESQPKGAQAGQAEEMLSVLRQFLDGDLE